jgi:hypothetical protein
MFVGCLLFFSHRKRDRHGRQGASDRQQQPTRILKRTDVKEPQKTSTSSMGPPPTAQRVNANESNQYQTLSSNTMPKTATKAPWAGKNSKEDEPISVVAESVKEEENEQEDCEDLSQAEEEYDDDIAED